MMNICRHFPGDGGTSRNGGGDDAKMTPFSGIGESQTVRAVTTGRCGWTDQKIRGMSRWSRAN